MKKIPGRNPKKSPAGVFSFCRCQRQTNRPKNVAAIEKGIEKILDGYHKKLCRQLG
jgi:hypothetical protein